MNMKQAIALTEMLLHDISEKADNTKFFLAISGGSSPKQLFALWGDKYLNKIPWNRIELFWVDERCVPPMSTDSNYGMAKREFLDKVLIPEEQIHRIIGENDPEIESSRYSELVRRLLPIENGIPVFDFVILGIGEDGHTSSIFPGQDYLYEFKEPYSPSLNPYNRQQRVAMTGLPIVNARMTAFYIVGESKKMILDRISNIGNKNDDLSRIPAAYLFFKCRSKKIFWDI